MKEKHIMDHINPLRLSHLVVVSAITAAAVSSPAIPAQAQVDPKFTFTTPAAPPPADATPPVEWKAQSKGGYVMNSGNAQTQNLTFGVNASRKEGNNKLALEGVIAYGKSKNLVAGPADANGFVSGLDRQSVVSTNNWATKGRYDRFLTANNSLYVSALGARDKVTSKKFFGGGQVGYSRQAYKSDRHLLVAELGYDLSFESYYAQGATPAPDAVTIHSARVFVGETLKLTDQTGLTASMESLFNLNKESKAIDSSDGSKGVKAFGDTRIVGKLAVTSNLYKSLSLGLGFTFKYDQNPSQRALPALPAGSTAVYPDGYASWKYADTVDTITEATLIYTFF